MIRLSLATGILAVCLTASASDYEGAMNPAVLTSQDAINAGEHTLHELFYRGAHLFSNRFTTNDGFGEAPDGPRREEQSLAGNPHTPFLRFNGLDAQSCLECHAAIGMREYGDKSLARESGSLAGSGGFSANVFIFEEPDNFRDGLVRNPPHIFGLGYVQRIAEEMTAELLAQQEAVINEAVETGLPVRRELTAKGISFGYITGGPTGAPDISEVSGVSGDLVIRPFQFKGIASSVRNFVTGALNFHFSIQPEELLSRNLIDDDNPNGVLPDDERYEIEEGDVSTLTIFASAMRPPQQDVSHLDAEKVQRGRALMEAVGCTQCHIPTLRIMDPRLTILDPRFTKQVERRMDGKYRSLKRSLLNPPPQMTGQEVSSALLPAVLLHRWETDRKAFDFLGKQSESDRPPGYTFHLSEGSFPSEAHPRLPVNKDGSIDVPVYTDFRRHDMGAALADRLEQETDVRSVRVPAELFQTRPLWGVADSGPWLHDGRATTLREAIVMHAGEGSEANASIAAYEALPESDRDAVIEFLKSLRVKAMKGDPTPLQMLEGMVLH